MPMSVTETERKILQLDNDVSEIYTMIADVQNTQRRHTHRFNEMGSRLDGLMDRQTGVESRLEGVEGRLDGFGVQMEEVLTILRERG